LLNTISVSTVSSSVKFNHESKQLILRTSDCFTSAKCDLQQKNKKTMNALYTSTFT